MFERKDAMMKTKWFDETECNFCGAVVKNLYERWCYVYWHDHTQTLTRYTQCILYLCCETCIENYAKLDIPERHKFKEKVKILDLFHNTYI